MSPPLLLLATAVVALAAVVPGTPKPVPRQLPTEWYHPRDHPTYSLFRRGSDDFPPLGSPSWSANFPQSTPDVTKLPPAWVNALNAAVSAGKIPDLPRTSNTPGTNPVYPQGYAPGSPQVCSATYKCRSPGDIWDAPPGYFLIGFDDGPMPPTTSLSRFLTQNNETATHFMIGINILQNPQIFQTVLNAGDDIAVHTWTHPYMTTLSNLDIVAQLGWTSLLIYNSTGGRLPRYWRPPYGDSDNRVRAIAMEVFGLQTVIWNQDTEDWSLAVNGTSLAKIQASFNQWLSGSKTGPGLIVLEHEISDTSVQAFMSAYPLIKQTGWITGSAAKVLSNGQPYQNPQNSSSPASLLNQMPGLPSGTPSSSTSHPGPSTTVTGNSLGASHTPSKHSSALPHGDVQWTLATLLAIFSLFATFP